MIHGICFRPISRFGNWKSGVSPQVTHKLWWIGPCAFKPWLLRNKKLWLPIILTTQSGGCFFGRRTLISFFPFRSLANCANFLAEASRWRCSSLFYYIMGSGSSSSYKEQSRDKYCFECFGYVTFFESAVWGLLHLVSYCVLGILDLCGIRLAQPSTHSKQTPMTNLVWLTCHKIMTQVSALDYRTSYLEV